MLCNSNPAGSGASSLRTKRNTHAHIHARTHTKGLAQPRTQLRTPTTKGSRPVAPFCELHDQLMQHPNKSADQPPLTEDRSPITHRRGGVSRCTCEAKCCTHIHARETTNQASKQEANQPLTSTTTTPGASVGSSPPPLLVVVVVVVLVLVPPPPPPSVLLSLAASSTGVEGEACRFSHLL